MMPFTIRVHKERAYRLFDVLLKAIRAKGYPYNQPWAAAPQLPENLPQSNFQFGGQMHAHFLFKVCYWMRGGIQSDTAFQSLSRLYETSPKLFSPHDAQSETPEGITHLLKEHRLGFKSGEIGRAWVENSRRLVERWDGDIVRAFDGVGSYEEAQQRIQNDKKGGGFLGFQEKMVSMLIYFLMDADFIPRWHFPLPVDFHVLRIMFAHEIIEPVGLENGETMYRSDVLATVRELCETYCREHDEDPLRLCDALWLLSRTLCERHPGNSSRVLDKKRRGRSTRYEPVRVSWTTAQTSAYMSTCWACPVESTCKWNIASADYYVRGALIRRSERSKPLLLFPRNPVLT